MAEVETALVVNWPVDMVYEKAKDIEALARFLPDLKEVRVLSREGNQVESFWKGEFQRREVKWRERDIWDDEKRECRFHLLEGDFKKYQGIWRFLPDNEKTRIELKLEYDLGLPLIGPLINAFLKKKMTENSQSMLKALQQILDA
ncbi:MAG TPA: SRPBCC family protein [Atribacteraceae bacterium]|nr:SRPBCC family protein [Atribacteraceae bacterium]